MKAPRKDVVRCAWASNDLAILYHDREWGVPQHDDRVLFEFLILEGAQAGLSWDTILRKRENYRVAFDGFDPKKIARYDRRKTQRLLQQSPLANNDGWKKDADAQRWRRGIDDRRRGIAIRLIITPAMHIAATVMPTSSVLGTAVVMSFHAFMVIFGEGRRHVYTAYHCD